MMLARLEDATQLPRGSRSYRYGNDVSAKLRTNERFVPVRVDTLDMFVVRNFLDAGECTALMRLIDRTGVPSTVMGGAGMTSTRDTAYRSSDTSYLPQGHAGVSSVERKLNALIGLPGENGEPLQGQRYSVGQEFKAHCDYFHEDQSYWPEQQLMGGQRTWTAMVFLNSPEAGGKTFFPRAGVRFPPRAGNLLLWHNLDCDGRPNPFSLHQGEQVAEGAKYILTKWYRMNRWVPPVAPGSQSGRAARTDLRKGPRRDMPHRVMLLGE